MTAIATPEITEPKFDTETLQSNEQIDANLVYPRDKNGRAINQAPEITESIHRLRYVSTALDDIEASKNAQANRLRTMTGTEPDKDGILRAFGLGEDDINVILARRLLGELTEMEAYLIKELQNQLKLNPLYGWIKAQRGLGDKQVARLLAVIGDPFWRDVDVLNTNKEDPVVLKSGRVVAPGEVKYPAGPRSRASLRAYAGLHVFDDGKAAHFTKGVQANWNAEVKKRAWLIIDSCMKQIEPSCKRESGIGEHTEDCKCSIYRIDVDQRREDTLLSHPEWTPKHSLLDGQRVAMNNLLTDLWRESRRIHFGGEYQKFNVRRPKSV